MSRVFAINQFVDDLVDRVGQELKEQTKQASLSEAAAKGKTPTGQILRKLAQALRLTPEPTEKVATVATGVTVDDVHDVFQKIATG